MSGKPRKIFSEERILMRNVDHEQVKHMENTPSKSSTSILIKKLCFINKF